MADSPVRGWFSKHFLLVDGSLILFLLAASLNISVVGRFSVLTVFFSLGSRFYYCYFC